MDITQLRQQIDRVDDAIVQLFQQRMDISDQIADYKKEHALPIFDPAREQAKLAQVAAQVPWELGSSVKVLYSLLFELSRSCQSAKNAAQTELFCRISAAIANTPQLFPQQAVIACQEQLDEQNRRFCQRISSNAPLLYFQCAEAVCNAVRQGLCPYGLLPLEDEVCFELLAQNGLFVVRAMCMPRPDGQLLRYLLVGRELEIFPGADKTMLLLTLPDKPGSLYRVLARFYTLGLNISRINSRPLPGDGFQMQFCFEIESCVYSREFLHLMCELDDLCRDFKYLGSYIEVV